jgi:hypothetical protein
MDGFKPSRKNRLDPFPDGFFQFLDGLKPSRNCVFFSSEWIQWMKVVLKINGDGELQV